MKIFVLNLDKNVDRMDFMRRQLDAAGLEFERFSGIYGIKLTPPEVRRAVSRVRSRLAMGFKLKLSHIGCTLSHVCLWRRIVEDGLPYALILEDDIKIGPEFSKVLDRAEKFINAEKPQVVVFSNYGNTICEGNDGIVPLKSFGCNDACLVTREAARRLVKANYPIIRLPDCWGLFSRRYGIELFRMYPTTVSQDNDVFASDMHDASVDPKKLLGTNGTGRTGLDLIVFRLRRMFEKGGDYILYLMTGR